MWAHLVEACKNAFVFVTLILLGIYLRDLLVEKKPKQIQPRYPAHGLTMREKIDSSPLPYSWLSNEGKNRFKPIAPLMAWQQGKK